MVNHPSYPAAHGCVTNAEAVILGCHFPRDAAALAARAEEARVVHLGRHSLPQRHQRQCRASAAPLPKR